MNYELYAEDKISYFFSTGRIIGNWWKSTERIGLCKLCGMEYTLPQRHGPIDLEHCFPKGIGSTNDGAICTECGRRTDNALTLIHNEIEHVAICPECLEAHHGLDYFTMKYNLLRLAICVQRIKWRDSHGP